MDHLNVGDRIKTYEKVVLTCKIGGGPTDVTIGSSGNDVVVDSTCSGGLK